MVYNVSYKYLINAKHLRIRFDKIERFIRIYDGTRYLILFGAEKYDFIYNKIRYLIEVKSGITYVVSNIYTKTKTDLYNSLSLEKKFTLHNVIVLFQLVFNKVKKELLLQHIFRKRIISLT